MIRFLTLFLLSAVQLHADTNPVHLAMQNLSSEHPRLFLTAQETPAWRERIANDPFLKPLADSIVLKADQLQGADLLERVVTGRRLLDISRTALKRIVIWSTAYRLTGESKYAERGIREMLNLAAFQDWNPSHFLDVAEMTAAMAIGYDWLYSKMSDADRKQISQAILEKGLRPSLPDPKTGKGNSWANTHSNWNQVCNAGMTLGALAIYEQDPELSTAVVKRAVAGLPNVLKTYAPDGAYVEGASYWSYGTTFNVLFLAAVEHALGTDFGLGTLPGFLESSDYEQQISGPSGLYFNYSDSVSHPAPQPALYWMAKKRNKPSLLWREWDELQKYRDDNPLLRKSSNRLAPFILLWAPEKRERIAPTQTHWQADGEMPVAFHRSDWSKNATSEHLTSPSLKLCIK